MEDFGVNQVGEEDAERPFNRLPDGLILFHIFDKIPEAQFLFRCSMVSKRFSGLVFQSKTVSVKIPLQIPDQEWTDPTDPVIPADYVLNLATEFLVKFTSVESLRIEFDCPGGGGRSSDVCSSTCNEPLVKWKIDLGSASFIMLFAESLNNDDVVVEEVDDRVGDEELDVIRGCVFNHLNDAFLTLALMKTLTHLLPESLRNVEVKDTKKQGGLVSFDGSEVIDVKMIKRCKIRDLFAERGAVKYWHKSLVKLPLSGSVMKGLCVIRYREKWDDGECDDLLAARAAFQGGGEEKVYGEAARQFLTMQNISSGILGYV
ncbi:uncharacterized protein [Coffea arabica]|uniref:F-box domain-containing protein n=1 Tax=Coffea arabica TaxID=13443 RepID=A0ABM4WM55_COFAR